tara:strand:+ start:1066 stop:1524 length:459 start_codon:yes stop_codon:yes gene_type:complete
MYVFSKIFFIKLFFLVFISQQATSQNKIKYKDSIQISKVMYDQEQAWNNGDISTFMNGYLKSKDIVFSGSSGPIYGWENTKERYLKTYPDKITMGKLSFTIKKVKFITENTAYLIGEYYLKRSIEDSSGHFTLMWVKKNDNWFIVSDHTTSK